MLNKRSNIHNNIQLNLPTIGYLWSFEVDAESLTNNLPFLCMPLLNMCNGVAHVSQHPTSHNIPTQPLLTKNCFSCQSCSSSWCKGSHGWMKNMTIGCKIWPCKIMPKNRLLPGMIWCDEIWNRCEKYNEISLEYYTLCRLIALFYTMQCTQWTHTVTTHDTPVHPYWYTLVHTYTLCIALCPIPFHVHQFFIHDFKCSPNGIHMSVSQLQFWTPPSSLVSNLVPSHWRSWDWRRETTPMIFQSRWTMRQWHHRSPCSHHSNLDQKMAWIVIMWDVANGPISRTTWVISIGY